MLFICYSKCSTCRKAEEWLKENGIDYIWRDIKTQNPTEAELRRWQAMSGLPLKKFFNTSGMQYRALGLSMKLPDITEDEQFSLLSADGMLVKRPILVGDGFALVGFNQKEWEEKLI
jgi:arsenate reductase